MATLAKDTPPPTAAAPRQNLALGLMLVALHACLILGVEAAAARALLLAHFGLFLMWQPLWQGTDRLLLSRAALVVAGGTALAYWSDWWLVGLWMAVLMSLIGGSAFGVPDFRGRLAPILAVLYLMAALLLWVVPHIVDVEESILLSTVVRYGLTAPLLAILVLRDAVPAFRTQRSVDLVYSLFMLLLVIAVVLGTVFVRQISAVGYSLALVQTVLGIAGVLLVLSWLWDPRGGFAGLGHLLSRYLLTVGMPFEAWMHSLANVAEQRANPQDFIEAAAEAMLSLPWLAGVDWRDGARRGKAGVHTRHATTFEFRGLGLTLYTQWRPSPALVLHMRLLARLLGDYYDAKVREQAQRHTDYLQAIYETGSRVTHDVKNLLQSLRSLCAVMENDDGTDSAGVRRLMARQLPQITHRLQATLEKLDAHEPATTERSVSASDWWRGLGQRFAHERVAFDPVQFSGTQPVSADLFDGVADNLIQNALEKRRRGECERIAVSLAQERGQLCLSVEDDGIPIPSRVATQLLVAPVESDTGLGVGLYQSARQAQRSGFQLTLAHNGPGHVRFELTPAGGDSP